MLSTWGSPQGGGASGTKRTDPNVASVNARRLVCYL